MELTTPSEEEGGWAASITLTEEQPEDREYNKQTMGKTEKHLPLVESSRNRPLRGIHTVQRWTRNIRGQVKKCQKRGISKIHGQSKNLVYRKTIRGSGGTTGKCQASRKAKTRNKDGNCINLLSIKKCKGLKLENKTTRVKRSKKKIRRGRKQRGRLWKD